MGAGITIALSYGLILITSDRIFLTYEEDYTKFETWQVTRIEVQPEGSTSQVTLHTVDGRQAEFRMTPSEEAEVLNTWFARYAHKRPPSSAPRVTADDLNAFVVGHLSSRVVRKSALAFVSSGLAQKLAPDLLPGEELEGVGILKSKGGQRFLFITTLRLLLPNDAGLTFIEPYALSKIEVGKGRTWKQVTLTTTEGDRQIFEMAPDNQATVLRRWLTPR